MEEFRRWHWGSCVFNMSEMNANREKQTGLKPSNGFWLSNLGFGGIWFIRFFFLVLFSVLGVWMNLDWDY